MDGGRRRYELEEARDVEGAERTSFEYQHTLAMGRRGIPLGDSDKHLHAAAHPGSLRGPRGLGHCKTGTPNAVKSYGPCCGPRSGHCRGGVSHHLGDGEHHEIGELFEAFFCRRVTSSTHPLRLEYLRGRAPHLSGRATHRGRLGRQGEVRDP